MKWGSKKPYVLWSHGRVQILSRDDEGDYRIQILDSPEYATPTGGSEWWSTDNMKNLLRVILEDLLEDV
jgi:hypothetical protein